MNSLHRHKSRRINIINILVFIIIISSSHYYYYSLNDHFFIKYQVVLGMRILVQRVKSASVTVNEQIISSISPGIVALVGIHEHDTIDDIIYCCKRLLTCKLWDNDNGQSWRQSVKQRDYDCLCVSQFTLYGTITKKSPSPDYKYSMKSIPAKVLYNQFIEIMKKEYSPNKIHDGIFGAMMDVALVNDGPVTIMIDSDSQYPKNNNNKNNKTNEGNEIHSSSNDNDNNVVTQNSELQEDPNTTTATSHFSDI